MSSSRRLEAECRRDVELMWLLGRLYPDHKSIAEFRRIHGEAVTAAGVELVRLAKSSGLVGGEWIAVDGTRFRAVASIDTACEQFNLQKYLDGMEKADQVGRSAPSGISNNRGQAHRDLYWPGCSPLRCMETATKSPQLAV
jgi:Transposase domain (DUF772)